MSGETLELELAQIGLRRFLRRLLFGRQRCATSTTDSSTASATCGTSVPIPRRLPRDSRTVRPQAVRLRHAHPLRLGSRHDPEE